MLAVRMIHARKTSIEATADILMQSTGWVRYWLRGYDDGGLDGLRDLLRFGRPRSVPSEALNRIIIGIPSSRITRLRLQQIIHERASTKLHITYIRKIMHSYSLSSKTSEASHQQGHHKILLINTCWSTPVGRASSATLLKKVVGLKRRLKIVVRACRKRSSVGGT